MESIGLCVSVAHGEFTGSAKRRGIARSEDWAVVERVTTHTDRTGQPEEAVKVDASSMHELGSPRQRI